jgi:hypothetical protein
VSQENGRPDRPDIHELITAHLEAPAPECRWCFAIDLERVPGRVLGTVRLSDASLVRLICPRCGCEFSFYSEGWEDDYLMKVISKLHPNQPHENHRQLLMQAHRLLFPEYLPSQE